MISDNELMILDIEDTTIEELQELTELLNKLKIRYKLIADWESRIIRE